MRHPTLEEFLKSDYRNAFVRYHRLKSYVRKNRRIIDGELKRCLDRANTSNQSRSRHNNTDIDPAAAKRTGLYRNFDNLMKQLAIEYGYDGIYVENVVNDFLPAKLVEYGYRCVSGASYGTPCYWWQPE